MTAAAGGWCDASPDAVSRRAGADVGASGTPLRSRCGQPSHCAIEERLQAMYNLLEQQYRHLELEKAQLAQEKLMGVVSW